MPNLLWLWKSQRERWQKVKNKLRLTIIFTHTKETTLLINLLQTQILDSTAHL
jgi:hypothetical protein